MKYILPFILLALAGCQRGGELFPEPTVGSANLLQATTCADVEQAYEDDAVAKVNATADSYLGNDNEYGYSTRGGDLEADRANTASAAPGSSPPSAAPNAHSETNVQVQGVDEADIVKFDGTRLFVLSRDGVSSSLRFLRSWPAAETRQVGSIDIEGSGRELFLDGDRLAVFSTVTDPRRDRSQCQNRPADGIWPNECYYNQTFTKVTLLHTDGDNLVVDRETYLEGNYTTSRRYDHLMRLVLQQWGWTRWWALPQIWTYLYPTGESRDSAAYEDVTTERGYTYRQLRRSVLVERVEAYRAAATQAIRERSVSDWIPARIERINGQLVAAEPDCAAHFLPEAGRIDYGTTDLVTLSLDDSAVYSAQHIRGYTSTVYSNASTMVLVQPEWDFYYRRRRRENDDYYENHSLVHAFALTSSGATSYEGSARVRGQARDQFNIDEARGHVRIVTTSNRWPIYRPNLINDTRRATTHNLVNTLSHSANGVSPVGQLELITDNETVQSVRYVGDIAYVVTFRQTDPLFAVDVRNPAQPRLLGELHIPGFSTYMHPIDTTHLLTIGFDADNTGRVTGLQLQIFDVSNPTAPTLAHRHVFATRGNGNWSSSEANWEHKAFTYFAAQNLLAFPVATWGYDQTTGSYDYRSTLEVFRVSTEAGFAPIASLDHRDFVGDYCASNRRWYCGYNDVAVRRGVFADDFVYSISEGGVKVHDTRAPEAAVASVRFQRRPGTRG